jgi:membrane protein DedA with SNARE-associated domain
MVPRHMKIWAWLLVLAAGLSVLKLARSSDSLDTILSWLAFAITLAFVCAYWWENRRSKQKPDQSSNTAIPSNNET